MDFVVYLSTLIRQAEGLAGGLAWLSLAGGTATATVNWVWCASAALLAHLPPGQTSVMRAAFHLYHLLHATLSFPGAAFLGAVALTAVTHAVLPRWLGWITAVVAVLQLVSHFVELESAGGQGPANFVSFLMLILWFTAASVALARKAWSSIGPAPLATE